MLLNLENDYAVKDASRVITTSQILINTLSHMKNTN